jgi:hypothetical protein
MHEGYITWIMVYPFKYNSYMLWWNGGTIREMLNDENWFNYESIDITFYKMVLTYSNNDM